MARPKLDIKETEIEKLASYGCKNIEIADFFNCSVDTITGRFSDILAKGRADLKRRIRKAQIDFALKGNATLLIWLGKNELGQSDNDKDNGLSELELQKLKQIANREITNNL